MRNRGGLQTLHKPSGSFPKRIPYADLEPFRQYLREQNYRDSTIRTKSKLISFLLKRVNLWDQEQVRARITQSHKLGVIPSFT